MLLPKYSFAVTSCQWYVATMRLWLMVLNLKIAESRTILLDFPLILFKKTRQNEGNKSASHCHFLHSDVFSWKEADKKLTE